MKIASTARDVYQFVENFQSTEIWLLLEDIRNTRKKVDRINSHSSVVFSYDELAFVHSYAAECDSVGSGLSPLVAKLTRKDRIKSRTVDSVRVAYHRVTEKNEIQNLLAKAAKLNDLHERPRGRLERVLNKTAANNREFQFSSIMAMIDRLGKRGFGLEISTGEVLDKSRELLRQQLTVEHRVADLVK